MICTWKQIYSTNPTFAAVRVTEAYSGDRNGLLSEASRLLVSCDAGTRGGSSITGERLEAPGRRISISPRPDSGVCGL